MDSKAVACGLVCICPHIFFSMAEFADRTIVMNNIEREEMPRLVQGGDEEEVRMPEFESACLSLSEVLALKLGWVLQSAKLTRSGEWGYIWRGNYHTAKMHTSDFANKIICWGTNVKSIRIGVGVDRAD